MANFCAVRVNETHLFVAGGQDAFLLEWATATWTPLPPMRYSRSSHACGVARNPTKVVVVGGDTYPADAADTVEIFDLRFEEWSLGPWLPDAFKLTDATTVAYGDSFILLGGWSASGASDKVYEFDPVNNEWFLRPEELKIGRSNTVAFAVPESLIVGENKNLY